MKRQIIKCEVCNRKLADLIKIDTAHIFIDRAVCDSCDRTEINMVIQRSSK